ncbi:hypothetical protein FDG95_gp462 [Pectobacterium phage vB_PcaM_CBB]|uniref:Uncharacterized protein n=1 Tax=Pectobacterium phage vB_PcaM_CBB TaxID=2772511 RepID=A0A1L2CVM4_9CAUD|nr:hypothetical protein FDG95_gp462 [Pectobacterium phage vB_PcaM_CBB]AMM44080.1 hypothetical protein CBB_517 [Pectobacterium phage vB_PcaM_CBB]
MLDEIYLKLLKNPQNGLNIDIHFQNGNNVNILFIDNLYHIFSTNGIVMLDHWYSRRLLNIKKRLEKLYNEFGESGAVITKINNDVLASYYQIKEQVGV